MRRSGIHLNFLEARTANAGKWERIGVRAPGPLDPLMDKALIADCSTASRVYISRSSRRAKPRF